MARVKISYQLIARYPNTTQEWIAFEDKSQDKVIQEYKRLKKQHPHIKFKIVKVTKEDIKI